MISLNEYLGKFFAGGKSLVAKAGGEIAAEAIADEVRERGRSLFGTAKPAAKAAYETGTASWFGSLSSKDELAFATIVSIYSDYYLNFNYLGPQHALERMQAALEFLHSKDPKEFARYRQTLARDPDEMRRVQLFGDLVKAPTTELKQLYFELVVTGEHPLLRSLDMIRKNAPKAAKRAVEIAKEKAQAADAWASRTIDTPEGKARAAIRRAEQVSKMKQDSQDLLVCRFMRRIFS